MRPSFRARQPFDKKLVNWLGQSEAATSIQIRRTPPDGYILTFPTGEKGSRRPYKSYWNLIFFAVLFWPCLSISSRELSPQQSQFCNQQKH